jgi:hypothetical protein
MTITFYKTDIDRNSEFSFFRAMNNLSQYNHLWVAEVRINQTNYTKSADFINDLKDKVERLSPNICVFSKTHGDVWCHLFVAIKDEAANDVFSFYAASGCFD